MTPPLASNFRLWAVLPAAVKALVLVDQSGKVSTVARPDFPAGVCRTCGCQERDACVDAMGECCAWTDATRTRGVRRGKARR